VIQYYIIYKSVPYCIQGIWLKSKLLQLIDLMFWCNVMIEYFSGPLLVCIGIQDVYQILHALRCLLLS
jgi:hypothetical protein